MQKNKVVQILKSLSSKEMRQLDKFIRSPIHNQHEDVSSLFQYLRKHLNGSELALRRERVFKFLFPDKDFDMQKVHHVSSYLLKTLEEFLAWKEWRKDESEFGLKLMQAYDHHKLDGQFKNALKKSLAVHHKQPLRDAHFHHLNYQLQFEEYNFARKLGRTRDFNLQQLSDAQDIAFLVGKLKNACLLLSHQAVTKTTYTTNFLDAIIDFLDGHQFLETPALAFYYHAYLALSDTKNEGSFLKLKEMLITQKEAFQINELRDLYILAINYCIRRLNTGDEDYLAEVFDIYKSGLEIDVFIDKGEFSPWTYSNIVQSGLKLGEFEKVEKVIVDYRDTLPEKHREAYYSYNYARFFYQKKNFKKAMPLLAQSEKSGDVLIACAAKTLLARMYFEQGETESLPNLLQSFKIFIRRKNVIAYHRELYLNFIKHLQHINTSNLNKKGIREKIAENITETKVIAAKEWLLGQLGK